MESGIGRMNGKIREGMGGGGSGKWIDCGVMGTHGDVVGHDTMQ